MDIKLLILTTLIGVIAVFSRGAPAVAESKRPSGGTQ